MAALPVHVVPDASGGIAAVAQQTAEQFGVNWPGLVAQAVSFLIVALILRRFVYTPLMRILDERRQRIADSLTDAERVRAELAAAEAQRRDVLEAARAEADRIVGEARSAAATLAEREKQRAQASAEGIVSKAREEALQERERIRAELRRELGGLVLQATAAVRQGPDGRRPGADPPRGHARVGRLMRFSGPEDLQGAT
jgi:F-type H+-transporting ATPase subunit b